MNLGLRNFVVLAVAVGCLAGCSDGLHTVPVYGAVTFVGREPPKVCRLFFRPLESAGAAGRPSVAQLDDEGSYRVKAFKDSEGLLPGAYRIDVTYFDLKPGGDANVEANWIQRNYDAGEVVVDADSSGVEHNIAVPKES